ncbi:MAG: hypothetical protein QM627_09330 [Luteolibacter sp.]
MPDTGWQQDGFSKTTAQRITRVGFHSKAAATIFASIPRINAKRREKRPIFSQKSSTRDGKPDWRITGPIIWRKLRPVRPSVNSSTPHLFQRYSSENPTALFVINSPVDPKLVGQEKGPRYRCNREFSTLIRWLKQQGVPPLKPIHTLRKEIGSIIASEHGIFAASRYLRHSDIHITAAVYADT